MCDLAFINGADPRPRASIVPVPRMKIFF